MSIYEILDQIDEDIDNGLCVPFPDELLNRAKALVGNMEIDLDAPIEDE